MAPLFFQYNIYFIYMWFLDGVWVWLLFTLFHVWMSQNQKNPLYLLHTTLQYINYINHKVPELSSMMVALVEEEDGGIMEP